MIKKVIVECQRVGLEVIATVCDQGTNNQSAINLLLRETEGHYLRAGTANRNFVFVINGQEIVPLYDIPHLFKGCRNNLLTKNLHFRLDGIAKWVHLQQFYELDASDPSLRMCSKLTDTQINPNKVNKMKVTICTQVFSHSVGSLMNRIAQWDIKDNNKLPSEAADTADLLLFMDKLFDSLNVLRISKPQAKPLKCAVIRKSPHKEFWQTAISVVDSMKFFCPQNGSAFNQHLPENFFSYIRSHGVRNTNPDVSHFVSSFKSLVINNCMSTHSPGSNCQKDITVRNLDTSHNFLTNTPQVSRQIVPQSRTKLSRCSVVYISGAIFKILKRSKTISNCEECRNHLALRHQTLRDDDIVETTI
nr:unnamed protein product [Callosobruchus analis]